MHSYEIELSRNVRMTQWATVTVSARSIEDAMNAIASGDAAPAWGDDEIEDSDGPTIESIERIDQ